MPTPQAKPSFVKRKKKCEFAASCRLYSESSYTCTNSGGSYCGKYRAMSRRAGNNVSLWITD
jgi:hypothetical protein